MNAKRMNGKETDARADGATTGWEGGGIAPSGLFGALIGKLLSVPVTTCAYVLRKPMRGLPVP